MPLYLMLPLYIINSLEVREHLAYLAQALCMFGLLSAVFLCNSCCPQISVPNSCRSWETNTLVISQFLDPKSRQAQLGSSFRVSKGWRQEIWWAGHCVCVCVVYFVYVCVFLELTSVFPYRLSDESCAQALEASLCGSLCLGNCASDSSSTANLPVFFATGRGKLCLVNFGSPR
jgi:hypothetical protein